MEIDLPHDFSYVSGFIWRRIEESGTFPKPLDAVGEYSSLPRGSGSPDTLYKRV
jgi:hypothetical protein